MVLIAALFLLLDQVLGQDSYCSFTPQHTMCRFRGLSTNCGTVYSRGLTEDEKWRVLDHHNRLRSKVSRGLTSQPPASNMLELEWDEELASVAQRLADQCQWGHDCGDCRKVSRFTVGQNLYMSFGYPRDATDWLAPMHAWFDDEIDVFPTSYISPFQFIKFTGHYTQIVWATTTKVGCGFTAFTSGRHVARYYVCNYGSAGNIIGRPMYRIGRGCSECPAYTSCSVNYPGICTYKTSNNSPVPRLDTVQTTWVTPETPPPVRSLPLTRTRVTTTNQSPSTVVTTNQNPGTVFTSTNQSPSTILTTTNQSPGTFYTVTNQSPSSTSYITPTNQNQGSGVYTPASFTSTNTGSSSNTYFISNNSTATTTTNLGTSSSPVRTRYMVNNQWSEWTTSY